MTSLRLELSKNSESGKTPCLPQTSAFPSKCLGKVRFRHPQLPLTRDPNSRGTHGLFPVATHVTAQYGAGTLDTPSMTLELHSHSTHPQLLGTTAPQRNSPPNQKNENVLSIQSLTHRIPLHPPTPLLRSPRFLANEGTLCERALIFPGDEVPVSITNSTVSAGIGRNGSPGGTRTTMSMSHV